jgi:DNA-binding MarR family transcriptional regulator
MRSKPGGVAAEIRQSKPFPTLRAEATIALFRTADMVHTKLESVLEPRGITVQQYNVLRILRGAGADGLPTLEIGERMVERTPGVTRLVDRLVAKALVARVRCTEDRRVVYCRISKNGLQLIDELEAPLAAASRQVFSGTSKADQQSLIALLDAVRAGCDGC